MKTIVSLEVEFQAVMEVTEEKVLQTFNIAMQNGTIVGSDGINIPGKSCFYS